MNVVILVSGTGTLLQSIVAAQGESYRVVGTVADKDCPAVERARQAGIPTTVVAFAEQPDRAAWNLELAAAVAGYNPDLVLSAGFMRILGPGFLERFPNKVINTHPALLPSFPGAHAVRDALAYGVKITGSTVHLVDEGVDTGPIIAQAAVDVLPEDSEATLHERIKVAERQLIVNVLRAPHVYGVRGVDKRGA